MVTKRTQDSRGLKQPSHKEDIDGLIQNISIERSGNKITIPLDLPLEAAAHAIHRQIEQEDKVVTPIFDFELTVPEGALALFNTLNDLHGFIDMMGVPGMFGDSPPQIITVQISKDKTANIPMGKFGVPGIDGFIQTAIAWRNKTPFFQLRASVPGKHLSKVQRIADAMRQRTDSVYKGAAVQIEFPDPDDDAVSLQDFFPKFLSINKVHPHEIIFSDVVQELVTRTLYTPIVKADICREHGQSLKRGILLEGPYGVGKTLCASVVANLCEEHGWTFIHMKDITQLDRIYALAKHHQPAVVFSEDLDERLKNDNDRDKTINDILNSLSGIDSEGVEIITMFTTNHVEYVTQAMLRPGRLDTIIAVRPPDAQAAQRLIRLYAGTKLAASEDLTKVGTLLDGKLASVVREVVERSKLGGISRLESLGLPLNITAKDLELAAIGMEAHNALLAPKEVDDRSDIELAAAILGDKLLELGSTRQPQNGSSAWHGSSFTTDGGKLPSLETGNPPAE